MGDYVVQSDKLYRCKTAITVAEAWTAAHWTPANVGDELTGFAKYNAVDLLKNNLEHYNTSYNGVVYTWSSDLSYLTVNGTATGQSWCTLFDGENTMPFGIEAGKTYYVKVKMPVNNLYLTIRQLGVNYTLISQIDADEPLMLTIDPACIGMEIRIQAVVGTTYNNVTVSEFSILNADSNLGLSERLNNLSIDVDATLSVSGKAADAQKTGALAAPVFSASIAYAAGQHVLNNGTLYVFTADHAAGAWTGTDATAVNLGGEISDLKNTINGIAQKLHLEIVGTTGLATNVYTPISKTRNYKVTNETAGTANFNIINADGTYTFLKAISAGASYNYTADNNYPGIRIYYASGGTCVFESDDNGVFAILSTKAETAVIEKKVLDSVGKIDETISGTADLSTNLLIPVYYGRKYKLTNNTSGYVNLNIIKSDGTFLLVDSVSAGATYEYLSDDNYKGIRIYFSTTGNCSFVSSDLGTYMSDTENSLNLIAIRDALIKNNSIDPFVILFDTNLQAFPLPNGTTFTIKKTDGTTFETNSVKMYSSNKTLLNTWNVNATSGTSRTITNNSGDGVYIQITNPSLVGIVIAYANSTQAKIEKIRVMQYNIGMFNYGQTGGLSQDVAIKIANYKKFLGEYQPNICGIEEYTNYIDSDSIYGSDATLFDDLYFYKEPSRAEALAVKSDYPYSAYQTFYVYSGSSDSRITAGMFVEYDANINGISVAVIAGAIAAGRTWEQRSDGFDELMTKLAGKENVIILIDTNVVSQSEHDDLVFIAETAGYSVANGGYFGMFDTYNLNSEHYHKIDNVLVKGDIVLKNVIVPDVYADLSSDHYPIIADVELKT